MLELMQGNPIHRP